MTRDIRQWLSLGLIVLVMGGAIFFASTSVSAWFSTRASTKEAIAEQSVPPAADPSRYLTPGETAAVASSNLQTRLNQAARNAGATTSRVQIDQGALNDPLLLSLSFDAEGEMDDLAALLHDLESTLPALIVDEARLTPLRNSSRLQLTARVSARREPGAVQ